MVGEIEKIIHSRFFFFSLSKDDSSSSSNRSSLNRVYSNNSVSISVSDDEPNDLNRIRTRRKRKKSNHKSTFELPRYLFRAFLRYWIVLLFLLAVGLIRISLGCLKLLPPDELENLDVLERRESNLQLVYAFFKNRGWWKPRFFSYWFSICEKDEL